MKTYKVLKRYTYTEEVEVQAETGREAKDKAMEVDGERIDKNDIVELEFNEGCKY